MKKSIALVFLLMMSISFVSAYSSFSFGNFFSQIDESTVILSAVFIISFAIIFFALSKSVFKSNTTIAGIIAGTSSFVIAWGINKTGFDISGFFYDIGISEELLMTIVPILIIAGAIFAIIKLKGKSLFVFGGLFILLSFFAYEKVALIVIGIIFLLGGFIALGRKKKGDIVIKR